MQYQNVSINLKYKDKRGNEKSQWIHFPMPVYKVNGGWYVPAGSLVVIYDLTVKQALARYDEKKKKAEVILLRIYPNGEYSSYTGENLSKTIEVFKMYLTEAPQIKYTDAGADHWLVGIIDYHPVVYLTNKDETVRWMLQPGYDPEYR